MQGAHRPGLLDSTTVRCADTPIALGCYSIAGPAEVSTIDPGQKRGSMVLSVPLTVPGQYHSTLC